MVITCAQLLQNPFSKIEMLKAAFQLAIIDRIADIYHCTPFCTCCACMQTQHKLELDRRDSCDVDLTLVTRSMPL